MVRAMKLVAEMKKELSVEERNLLSVGYKNIIGSRRASWRTVVGIEAKALEGDDQLRISTAQEYREEIEQEMKAICNDALQVLDNYLIPLSTTAENKVFFYKMFAILNIAIIKHGTCNTVTSFLVMLNVLNRPCWRS